MELHAMVVDDSRVMRKMVMESLKRTEFADFVFTEAEDGEDALVKFDPHSIDIIFCDWNMPNLTGIEFTRKLRETTSAAHVPIVMVTSEKTSEKVHEALSSAGADAYITKPFTVEDLNRKLSGLSQNAPDKAKGVDAGFFAKVCA